VNELNEEYAIIAVFDLTVVCFTIFMHGLDGQTHKVSFNIGNLCSELAHINTETFFCFRFSSESRDGMTHKIQQPAYSKPITWLSIHHQ